MEGSPPSSWATRKRDNCTIPVELQQLKNSYKFSIHPKIPPSMRSFHYDYLSRTLPSLTKLSQFKNNEFTDDLCPRPECKDLSATSEHIVFHCIFATSILNFVKKAKINRDIDAKMDDNFYLFPFTEKNNHKSFLESFILATQIKMTAFKIVTEERFHSWNHNHFYLRLLNILKNSIQICELYHIDIKFLHELLEYAEVAGIGLLHSYMNHIY